MVKSAERNTGPARRAVLAIMALILISPALAAQGGARVRVRIGDISGEGISAEELGSLRVMISSYVGEIDGFQLAAETEPSAPMTLSGKISLSDGKFLFVLRREGSGGAGERSVSASFASVNDIVLRARDLTRRILDSEDRGLGAAGAEPGTRTEALDARVLAGTWKGDKGIDRVRFSADGSGSAILSSGHAMRLRCSVGEGRFIIEQDQEGEAAFYASPNYSLETARRIARQARPMRWLFRLSEDGKTLSGIKESVAVSGDSGGKLTIDNEYTREAVWTRIR